MVDLVQVLVGEGLVLLDVEKSGSQGLTLLGLKHVDREDLVGVALRYHVEGRGVLRILGVSVKEVHEV